MYNIYIYMYNIYFGYCSDLELLCSQAVCVGKKGRLFKYHKDSAQGLSSSESPSL